MNKKGYETAVLLAAGAVLGQIIAVLLEMSFTVLSFIPVILVIAVLGGVSLRAAARHKGLTNSSVKTRITTGVWIILVWELLRRRSVWPVDILKFSLLLIVLLILVRIVQKTWEESND